MRTTVLSLLIALISTAAATLPIYRDYLAKNDSDIYIRYLGRTREVINLVTVNSGTKAGFVSEGRLYFVDRPDRSASVRLAVTDGNALRLVPAGEVVPMLMRVRRQSPASEEQVMRNAHAPGQRPRCWAEVEVSNFSSSSDRTRFDMPCIHARMAVHYAVVPDPPDSAGSEDSTTGPANEAASNSAD